MNTFSPSMKILVINDFLPDKASDEGHRLMQVLQGLRELGHEITFIARDGKNQVSLEPGVRKLGIQVYSGDFERLPALGKDVANSVWSLHAILAQKQFDVALLIQNFRCGISVPEHYLDAIRKDSPQTRVLILNDVLYGKSACHRAEITRQLEHREVAEDWSAREREAFQRADLVIVKHGFDKAALHKDNPAIDAVVIPPSFPPSEPRTSQSRKGMLLNLELTQPGDVDGFTWFLQKIWPAVCRISSEIELLVCGAEQLPLATRRQLDRVRWLEPNDHEYTVNARLFIAPLRFGKVSADLTRMIAEGVPGVITNYAAEFAGFQAGSGVLVANTPEEFTASILQLYQNPEKWKEVSGSGVQFAKEEFSWESLKRGLQNTLVYAQSLTPKSAASTTFSMTRVDSLFGESLSKAPSERRGALRLDGHVQLAQELLRSGKPAEARAQLRHVFSWLGESIQYSAPLARLLSLLARCYRELSEPASVAVCAQQARRCFFNNAAGQVNQSAAIKAKGSRTISLIVPTFNRLPILKKCMAALEKQTFPAKDFEVVVIDDGSSDGTEAMMQEYRPPFRLQYLRQANSGTGAARRNGVAHAKGEYLLLMNDDTICDPDVIEQHIQIQRERASERWAVLGNFEYPAEAHQRAFTHFLRTGSFMFPQIDMEAGFPYPYSHFITCNLSIRRQAVVEAGSFDSTYKLSEDTELGIRLFEMGYGVLYHPAAHAWHDHLPYAVGNLIRRARVYGADYFYMFRKHPRVIREWAMPVNLTGMDSSAARLIQQYLDANRHDVEKAAAALNQWENVEFEPFLTRTEEAAKVTALFQQNVPAIHWFYLLEKMLETMTRELDLSLPGMPESLMAGAASNGR
ncbi:MAG TPA: glycosyltransferase [Terriglobales bacterium]|nr:glycosyltransferase [Terriglobales bacterium]